MDKEEQNPYRSSPLFENQQALKRKKTLSQIGAHDQVYRQTLKDNLKGIIAVEQQRQSIV